jgi:hypothetical protein
MSTKKTKKSFGQKPKLTKIKVELDSTNICKRHVIINEMPFAGLSHIF